MSTDFGLHRFPCGCAFPIVGPPPFPGGLPRVRLDLENAREDCPATWELIGKGLTKGVFQLEAQLGRTWSRLVRPEGLEHMSALGAILRPGTLKSIESDGQSLTAHYAMRKNGEEAVPEFHPVVDKILARTYGVLVYQESAIAIVVETAGFTPVEADALRRASGKKDPEEMAKVKKLYLERAKGFGVVSEEQAAALFGWIEKSQRYQFNACLHENVRLRRASPGKYSSSFYFLSVGEMHRVRNDIEYAKATKHNELRKKWKFLGSYGMGVSLCEDGRCRPNAIRDVRPAGKQMTYKVTLENGSSTIVTGGHRFPTNAGEITVDQLLMIREFPTDQGPYSGISFFVCGEYEKAPCLTSYSGVTAKEMRDRQVKKSINGQKGVNNWAYTNGSYTKFHDFKSRSPKTCEACGKTNEKRIEVHHVNGDRTNSDPENLMALCVSCHKLAHYKMGRTKRGEKGYPSTLLRVVSVEPFGEAMTYDVEMAAPNHNFVVEGEIVTSNSHSYSYGLVGYRCAYLKAHFPKVFFASALRNSHYSAEPQQEKLELVNDARLFDVKVVPPDVTTRNARFRVVGDDVVFGLADVKGVGESQVGKLKRALKALGFSANWSWWDYLSRACDEVGHATTEKLISAGAFDRFGLPRRLMLEELRCWSSALTPACREAIKALGAPLYKTRAIKREVDVEVDEFAPGEVKAHRDAVKRREALLERFARGEEVDVPPPSAPPVPIGKKVVRRKRSVKDEDGVQYEVVLDPEGRPVAIDPPRPAASLQEGVRNVLSRNVLNKAARLRAESELALLERPIVPVRDTPAWTSYVEQELLGVSLTCQKVDSCDSSEVNTTCREFFSGKAGYMVLGVEVRSVREVVTRKGKNPGAKMAFLGVTDGTYLLDDVVVFPDVYKEHASILQVNNTILIQASRSDKKGSTGLVCQRAWQMNRS